MSTRSFSSIGRTIFYNCNRPAGTCSLLVGATGCLGSLCPSVGLEVGAGNLSSLVGGGPATTRVYSIVSIISISLGSASSRGCSGVAHGVFPNETFGTVLGFAGRYITLNTRI